MAHESMTAAVELEIISCLGFATTEAIGKIVQKSIDKSLAARDARWKAVLAEHERDNPRLDGHKLFATTCECGWRSEYKYDDDKDMLLAWVEHVAAEVEKED